MSIFPKKSYAIKYIGWYLKGLRGSAGMRNEINKMTKLQEIYDSLNRYKEELLSEYGR